MVSVLTKFIAGLGANFEYAFKRIIALSSLRRLGFMIMTISIGLSGLDFFFHLLNHVLFKALLFVCGGGVIHSMGILRIFVL